MKKHLLFITEGIDDVAIISSIIEHLGVAKEKYYLREIDEFCPMLNCCFYLN